MLSEKSRILGGKANTVHRLTLAKNNIKLREKAWNNSIHPQSRTPEFGGYCKLQLQLRLALTGCLQTLRRSLAV